METDIKYHRKPENIERELSELLDRIDKRIVWLQHEPNKMRGTYSAVAKDTRQMSEKAEELQKEYEAAVDYSKDAVSGVSIVSKDAIYVVSSSITNKQL